MFDISGGLSLTRPGEIIKHLFIFVLAFEYLKFILSDSYEEEYKILIVKDIIKLVLYFIVLSAALSRPTYCTLRAEQCVGKFS